MHQYLDLLRKVLAHGVTRSNRTGIQTRALFGQQMQYDLSHGFPLLTTKAIHLKSVIYELLWLIRGDTNVAYLQAHGVSIWDEWADAQGDLGPVYGHQWRSWQGADGKTFDQLQHIVDEIKHNPDSRRLVVSAWNVADLEAMRLPPCHILFQFHVAAGKLSCQLYQRSADLFLGVPFNIASYALLTHMVAQVTGLQAGRFIHTLGDVHLYENHIEQARLQLSRETRSLPTLQINPQVKNLFQFAYEDFELQNYHPHPHIAAPVAV